MDISMRPRSDLNRANWEEVYRLTKYWKSDMEFYHDELNFLDDLVGKYFLKMIRDESSDKVQKIAKSLLSLIKQQLEIVKRIDLSLESLKALINNNFSSGEQQFREEHASLENDFFAFLDAFREVKKAVFGITEHIMELEKMKHLLSHGDKQTG